MHSGIEILYGLLQMLSDAILVREQVLLVEVALASGSIILTDVDHRNDPVTHDFKFLCRRDSIILFETIHVNKSESVIWNEHETLSDLLRILHFRSQCSLGNNQEDRLIQGVPDSELIFWLRKVQVKFEIWRKDVIKVAVVCQVCTELFHPTHYIPGTLTRRVFEVLTAVDEYQMILESFKHHLLIITKVDPLVPMPIFGMLECEMDFHIRWIHNANQFEVVEGQRLEIQVAPRFINTFLVSFFKECLSLDSFISDIFLIK